MFRKPIHLTCNFATTEKKPEKPEKEENPENCLKAIYILSHRHCLCYEENTAYYGNNHRFGDENPQETRLACQRSCEAHPSCHFWTFRKPLEGEDSGLCYLKTKRENVTPNVTDYVSGSKGCKLPEWTGIQSDISGLYSIQTDSGWWPDTKTELKHYLIVLIYILYWSISNL